MYVVCGRANSVYIYYIIQKSERGWRWRWPALKKDDKVNNKSYAYSLGLLLPKGHILNIYHGLGHFSTADQEVASSTTQNMRLLSNKFCCQ